ncbi:MAG: D-alanine--D-alanine ligase A [Bacteroidetes bacterium QS_9_68_14]|nr:MAG: D-alanine--D-alanine ligase A [Bacteroidetes bacterium QS_9_68_14]
MPDEGPIHVGLIYGGRSPEHEVSIDSARNVFEELTQSARHRVTPIRIDRRGRWHVEPPEAAAWHDHSSGAPEGAGHASRRALLAPAGEDAEVLPGSPDGTAALEPLALDVAFPLLHGPNGEDGRVQGLLHTLDLPYVGPDVLGSALCMDKDVAKRLLRDADLPVVPFRVLHYYGGEPLSFDEVADALGVPFFVKPANAGSSVGTAKVETEPAYAPAVRSAFAFDNKVLLETAIDGREIECAVIGNQEAPRVAGPGEIVSEDTFYTYEAKYDEELDAAHMEVPADLPGGVPDRARSLAERAYRLAACEGLARVDFFFTEEDGRHDLLLNEINTIPGFTERSMFPVMWEDAGLPAGELAAELIRLALERHERDARLKMTP